jgi:hypothetical protein
MLIYNFYNGREVSYGPSQPNIILIVDVDDSTLSLQQL